MLVGVDIGGTFTDLVMSEAGHLRIHKLFSTPAAPAQAMLAGLAAITPGGLAALDRVAHGSTVATNAILERKGARVAFITTAGFRDVLFIARQNRPELYALHPTLPPPLIPRDRCYEVSERLDHTGAVIVPLDMAALDRMLDAIGAQKVDAIAVCLLYSYVNPAHEHAIRARILERGMLDATQIALSCEVLPEFREYERASTVALEAYVRPIMSRYLTVLEAQLPPTCGLRIMKSDGGVISARTASRQAVQTALSGPAAGVIGAFHIAATAGFDHIITIDIGGTSTDVALCPGEPIRHPEREIDGLPLRIRLLDIETIGAGGGSIARLDAGGALRVGPESAGADPGSIIYGRGGKHITVSDANALLGRLDAQHFLGGAYPLAVDAARQAMEPMAEQMGLSVEDAANGVIAVANANIDRALRRVSVARGYDPRDFTLVAFGGAGPLHACAVADQLSIPRVLVPRYPGVLCAYGLLVADVALDYSRAALADYDFESSITLRKHLEELIAVGRADLAREGIHEAAMIFRGAVDMRYRGQAYELTIPFSGENDLLAAFHAAHARRYGHAMPERAVETVTVRVQAIGVTEKPVQNAAPVTPNDGASARLGRKTTAADGKWVDTTLYDRERLTPGAEFSGPALIFQLDSTTFIPAGWRARVDAWHNLVLEHDAQ